MQTTGQLINSNTQAIVHLEMQLSQLATTISERGKKNDQANLNLTQEPKLINNLNLKVYSTM